MRPLFLNLAATTVLAVCGLMIVHQSGRNDSAPGNPTVIPRVTKSARNRNPSARVSAPKPQAEPSSHRKATAAISPANNLSPSAGETFPNESVAAIQLAADIQLPAALMAQEGPELEALSQLGPAAVAANLAIVNSFYQELAASAGAVPAAGERLPENQENTEVAGLTGETTVIPPGPEVAMARARADEIYRALFGDEAYNRQTMNSVLEVRLPVVSGED
ncbi:MAG: hypothetical protein NTW21_18655 [Verrucomicrobia bacterium]|nr:hypothetical protein [Verrucomicrobiota bacterium]